MAIFSSSELLEIALGIERNGVAYYSSLAELATDASLKDTYNHLAAMEREHIKIFQEMLNTAGKYQPPYAGEAAEEYEQYLEALVNSTVFTDDKVARQMAQKAAGPAEAIQLALGAEKDSILFYNEMRDLVPKQDRPVIDKIINEERSHMRQLVSLKKEFVHKGGQKCSSRK
jgi:rubrerythrin